MSYNSLILLTVGISRSAINPTMPICALGRKILRLGMLFFHIRRNKMFDFLPSVNLGIFHKVVTTLTKDHKIPNIIAPALIARDYMMNGEGVFVVRMAKPTIFFEWSTTMRIVRWLYDTTTSFFWGSVNILSPITHNKNIT